MRRSFDGLMGLVTSFAAIPCRVICSCSTIEPVID
jgi:hypothetical protein